MGGKIPREIKERVIRGWLQGIKREKIAETNDLADGSITNIVKDASLQAEYHDMELFRHLAVILNENGLEPVIVGFAVRLLKIMKDNGIDVNQVEPIISDFAIYCFKHQISFDKLIQSGYEALALERELGVPVKMLSEHVTQAKITRDDLLDQSQTQLRMLRDAQSEYEIIKSKLEEFKKEYPLVESSIELKKELDETKERCKQYEQINGLERKLSEADEYNTRLEGANVDKDSKLKTAMHQLSVYQERLDKQKKEEVNDGGSYYRTTKKMQQAEVS
jgi:hypothetical protein